jgi:ubiquinone/menaquinone biosynthesis C-methylase UbiE
MSRLDDVRRRFEWDAESFAGIYTDSSMASRVFNRLFRKAIFVRYETAMNESCDPRGKSFLDIGCGSGVYSVELAKRGAKRVLGIDFSESMISLARNAVNRFGLTGQVELVQAEFLSHDFAGETFDVSIAMGVFDYLEQPEPFLAKMSRLTRGKVLASFPRFSLLRGSARRLRYRATGRGDVFYYSSADVSRLARRAGIERHRLLPVNSSGGGVILIGDNSPWRTVSTHQPLPSEPRHDPP